ncbi:type-1 fimbrial protein subunit A [Caballeronia novacaledonica]|uniref:Type-1 fimbrial protein subunit A n=1 Tax=Caballeronia novacaledonica TaxID=1544861 RepID=A0A2U3HYH4_9BURK|nr:fimbrial protein [Caballeronia novacaledonica]SPB12856.1 type-1 fimbrial protein subunit A [Caballeronia novacaledonica]
MKTERRHTFRASGRWLLLMIVAFVASVMSLSAHATSTCNDASNNNALNAGTIAVPVGAAAGMTVSTLTPVNFIVQCRFLATGSQNTSTDLTGKLSITNPLAGGFSDVYQTNISGLGVRYTVNSPGAQCNITNQTIQNGSLTFTCTFNGAINGPYTQYSIYITASLVVTGPIASGASTLSSAPVVAFSLTTIDSGGPWSQQPAYSGAAAGTLTHATCSVSQASVSVDLPTADSNNLGSIGATTAPKAFALTLSCQTGSIVLITLTDSVNPANRGTALQLAPGSTAAGVGIQILNSAGTPVSFGADSAAPGNTNQWSIGTSPDGTLQVPLTARYVRTGSVTAGTVKALATFTMSYQ